MRPGVTYFYRLEDVDTRGRRTIHGPVWALLPTEKGFKVFLPIVAR